MTRGPRLLLTEEEWRWWFGVGNGEARRLVAVQRALLAAGIDACPDTTVGMSRVVLASPDAAARLRLLADRWDEDGTPAAGAADREDGWPLVGEGCGRRGGWVTGSSGMCRRGR